MRLILESEKKNVDQNKMPFNAISLFGYFLLSIELRFFSKIRKKKELFKSYCICHTPKFCTICTFIE